MMTTVSANSRTTLPLSSKSEMIDIELNSERDDEEMEDGETGFDDGSVTKEIVQVSRRKPNCARETTSGREPVQLNH